MLGRKEGSRKQGKPLTRRLDNHFLRKLEGNSEGQEDQFKQEEDKPQLNSGKAVVNLS